MLIVGGKPLSGHNQQVYVVTPHSAIDKKGTWTKDTLATAQVEKSMFQTKQ